MSESSNSGTPLHDFCTNALVGLELLNQLEEKGFILSSTSEQIMAEPRSYYRASMLHREISRQPANMIPVIIKIFKNTPNTKAAAILEKGDLWRDCFSPISVDVEEPTDKFTGRKNELTFLHDTFIRTRELKTSRHLTNLVLISGLSGVGKSELSKQLLFELQQKIAVDCIWLKGSSKASFKESIRKLASRFGLAVEGSEVQKSSLEVFKKITKEIVKRDISPVFIIDNLDKASAHKSLTTQAINHLKTISKAFVIVTSQFRGAVDVNSTLLELNVWSDVEAYSFVSQDLKFDPNELKEEVAQQEIRAIEGLCKELDNHPLILNIAVDSIKQKRRDSTEGKSYSVHKYLTEICSEKFDKELPKELGPLSRVWNIVQKDMAQAKKYGCKAIDVMGCLAYLDPDGIRKDNLIELLASSAMVKYEENSTNKMKQIVTFIKNCVISEPGAYLWPNRTKPFVETYLQNFADEIDHCLVCLKSLSLVHIENNYITIHRLIQKVVRLTNPRNSGRLAQPPNYNPLYLLAKGAQEVIKKGNYNRDVLKNIVVLWNHMGKIDELLMLFTLMPPAISEWMIQLGLPSDNLEFLQNKSNERMAAILIERKQVKTSLLLQQELARAYQLVEDMTEADKIYQELLPKMESVLGKNDKHTIRASINYGAVLRFKKRPDEAFELYKELLKRSQQLANEEGSEETDITISIKQKLAHLHGKRGELEQELKILQDLVYWKQSNLGSSPKTMKEEISEARTRHNLGCCYMRLQRYAEAKQTFKDVYRKRLELLKEDHPSTLNSKHDLAEAMLNLKEDQSTALQYLEEVLVWKTKVQGENHKRTLLTKDAITYWSKMVEERSPPGR